MKSAPLPAGVAHEIGRPRLAIIAPVPAPYRTNVHRRIARELPEVSLSCLYLRAENDQPWMHENAPETRPVMFGNGEGILDHRPVGDGFSDFRKGGRVIRWLERERVEAIVCGGYSDAARMRVLRWARSRRVPCFLTADSNSRCDRAQGLKRIVKPPVVRTLAGWAAGVLVFGRRGFEYYTRYGVPPDRIGYFPYEPDYTLADRVSAECVDAIARRYGLAPDRKRIVCCARLVGLKRLDLAIAGFLAIARERPDWDLVIIGDGPLRDELRASIPDHLRHRVFWTGFVNSQEDIFAIYRACDVMLHTADYEAWGMVLNEAAAAGLAIVSSDIVGAAGDLVEDGVNGKVFPAGDLPPLVESLRFVTDEARTPELRAGSTRVLGAYRERCDPVAGLRRVLEAHGVIS